MIWRCIAMKGSFGFIYEKLEIKILILFIMRRLPEPVSFDVLTEVTMSDDRISYFDYIECLEDLVKTEHLRLINDTYFLTAKGARNCEITENSLPYSVRINAENAASASRTAMDRDAMIETSHTVTQDGGCTVSMTLSDGIGDVVSMNLFAANEQQALKLEKGFRKNAESIYSELIEMILG